MKHKVTLTVKDGNTTVLKGSQRRLPARLLRFLFGDFQQIYMLAPGKTVMSIDVQEEK